MLRTLKILFRRDPRNDRLKDKVFFEGYRLLWPDGRPVEIGVSAFCNQGQRLLGLGKYLDGCTEKLIELLCFHLSSRDQDMTKLPGHRVRRFYLERHGPLGTIHFMDGTPTAAVFDLNRDEPCVLQWIGLSSLGDGEQLWLDLAARMCDNLAPASKQNPGTHTYILPDSHA